VHHAETGLEHLQELAEMALCEERMRLKDEIAAMLAAA
jgi:uncharacterized protein YdcH (DUF465 family)